MSRPVSDFGGPGARAASGKREPFRGLGLCLRVRGPGYRATLVIDSLVGGTSSGGVRIVDGLEVHEVRILAREMSLKYGFFKLPRGGAKTGIRLESSCSSGPAKLQALRDFGSRIRCFITSGVYYPGMDMNCGPEDLKAIYEGAGISIGGVTDTSHFTAMWIAAAIQSCAEFLGPKNGPWTIAVEGFGRVAGHLAARLDPEKYSFVALSTLRGAVENASGFEGSRLSRLQKEAGDSLIDHLPGARSIRPEQILEAPVDILVPSARTGSINDSKIPALRARAVVPIANAPYAGTAARALHLRRVLCLPGFVTNAGGVFASSLFDQGVPLRAIEALTGSDYRRVVTALLARSAELGVSPLTLARRVAFEQIHERNLRRSSQGLAGRLGRKLARRAVPRAVRAHRIEKRAKKSLEEVEARIRRADS